MYFDTKNYLKSTRNHTVKHARILNCYLSVRVGREEILYVTEISNKKFLYFHIIICVHVSGYTWDYNKWFYTSGVALWSTCVLGC
jgi:hypothetical protein